MSEENRTLPPVSDSRPVEDAASTEGVSGETSKNYSELMRLRELLARDSRKVALRFIFMLLFFLTVFFVLIFVSQRIYSFAVGRYAVLENISIRQNPGNQGQLEISYDVRTPGRVYLRRESGGSHSDLIFDYKKACHENQHWNWNYVPGTPIKVQLWSRRGLKSAYSEKEFQTCSVADIVILMDTTESMDDAIRTLREKCESFARDLKSQNVEPRFALIAYGDANLGKEWIHSTAFLKNSDELLEAIGKMQRFEGGDAPESALDAIEFAIEKVKKESKGHVVRFYLITDQEFHPVTAGSKVDASGIAKALKENRIRLEVFGNAQFKNRFEVLLGDCGRFHEVSQLGEVLTGGCFLGD